MKRLKLITTAFLIATLAGGLVAQADPVLIISDGVTSTGPITLTGGSGNFSTASFDSSWSVVVSAGESKPLIGGTSNPNMELNIQATSLGSANPLTIILSDNNFGPTSGSDNAVAQLIGQPIGGTGSDVIFNTYYNSNNALAGVTTLLTTSGSVLPSGGQYVNNQTNSLSVSGPYSLTEVVQIDGNQAATYSLLANLQATNEACNCSLTFNTCLQTNMSVYQSCYIPNPKAEVCYIKATDTCLGNVPVVFLGAVTNQICTTNVSYCQSYGTYPSYSCYYPNYSSTCTQSYSTPIQNISCSTVITFTFGAVNGCGKLQTMTQRVTVQAQSYQPPTCYQQPTCYGGYGSYGSYGSSCYGW